MGEIKSVQASASPMPDQPELVGTAAINLSFEGGPTGSMLYSCLASEKMIGFRVYGTDEETQLSGWDFHLANDASTIVAYENRNEIFFTETAAFLKGVATGSDADILSDFHDALRTQRVVDTIHRAMESGATEALG